MNRRMVLAGLSAAILGTSSFAALAAPCGPAVLSKVDGKVLVNRGVGFLDGKAGMPLAVGDHVMLRGGTAEILFVNGTGSALSGAKSLPITACSADASMLTSPALAQAPVGSGSTNPLTFPATATTGPATTGPAPLSTTAPALSTPVVIGGTVLAGAVIGGTIAATNSGGGGNGGIVIIQPVQPTSP
ncbi:MAG: hypothetical protein H2042_12600 [Rhizobiales bacterium]|nr:hypothetical protein [Hyphomicrobiales bacterium]